MIYNDEVTKAGDVATEGAQTEAPEATEAENA